MAIINTDSNKRKGWLSKNMVYYYSGENALYMGEYRYPSGTREKRYSGLGLHNMSESTMRENLRQSYNSDLSGVITNGAARAISRGNMANALIKWVDLKRPYN